MCIFSCINPGAQLTEETLKICYENNPDGAGFAYVENEKVIIKRGYFTFESFYNDYILIPISKARLVHFRISTSGQNNEENCHPFSVNEELAFVHNGVLTDFSYKDSPVSDTYIFNERVLKPFIKQFGVESLNLDFINYMFGETIMGSKIALLDNNENFYFFNESAGHWNEDNTIYYSNKSYEPKPVQKNKSKCKVDFPATSNILHVNFAQRNNGKSTKNVNTKGNSDNLHTIILNDKVHGFYEATDESKTLLTEAQLNLMVQTGHRGIKKMWKKYGKLRVREVSDDDALALWLEKNAKED